MSWIEVAVGFAVGLIVNELTDLSPRIARRLVVWSARLRYGSAPRAVIRAEELAAVVDSRPGKLFKLGTGAMFAAAAVVVRLRRNFAGEELPTEQSVSEDALDLVGGPLRGPLASEAEASLLVARYLFPTERYRGEWRRHWIHVAKGVVRIGLLAALGIVVAVQYVPPRYARWIVACLIAAATVGAGLKVAGWYLDRFVITNKRLMATEGVVNRRVVMIPLLKVVDLRYIQSPLGRLLNYGTFVMESGSRRNALRKIVDLPNPSELYLRVIEEVYEPEAVEARIARAWSDTDHEKTPEPDPEAVQREIIFHVGTLAAQLEALAAAIGRLTPDQQTSPAVGDAADNQEEASSSHP